MRVLAIETSGAVGAVACGDPDAGDVTEVTFGGPDGPPSLRPPHARLIAPTAEDLLAQRGWSPTSLELLVIGLGPGSYTGIRVGLAFVKGLALATGVPVVGVSSLHVLAAAAPPEAGPILALRDARFGEVAWAVFAREVPGGSPVRRTPDAMGALADALAACAPGTTVVADPLPPDHGVLAAAAGRSPLAARPSATALAHLGVAAFHRDGPAAWRTLAPLYLRASNVERSAR